MRLLCLDVGEKRIGVALSDPGGSLARPLLVIEKRSKREDFQTIGELVDKWGVERLIVGLPLTSEGELGPQARRVKRYARALSKELSIPIDFADERYSTVDAMEIMREARGSHRRQREDVDSVAAAVILQSYLDQPSGLSGVQE